MNIRMTLFVLILGLTSSSLWAETWTDSKGQALEAEFESYDSSTQSVKLKRTSDGKSIPVRVDQLSDESRALALTEWQKRLPTVTVKGEVQVVIPHQTETEYDPGTQVEFVIYDKQKKAELADPQISKLNLKWDPGLHGLQGSISIPNIQVETKQSLLIRVTVRASFNKKGMKKHVLEEIVTSLKPDKDGVLDLRKVTFKIRRSDF
jgi:hypothetical protein